MLNLFITSPLKHSGKTFITAGLAATMQSLGYTTSVYKPIQTAGIERAGFMQSPDLTYIKTLDPYINTHFSFLFKSDSEPIIASEQEEEAIDIELINKEYKRIIAVSDCTIVDSDGGIMTPIAPNTLNADLIKTLQIPVLLTVKPDADAVTSTLSSIYIAQEKGINIRGVVIDDITDDCSKNLLTSLSRLVEEFTNVKILGLVPHLSKDASPEDIISAILNGIDIESVFDVKIEKLDMN